MCTSIIEIARAEGMAKRGDAWFPLAPGEAWHPPYGASQRYLNQMNRGFAPQPAGQLRVMHFCGQKPGCKRMRPGPQ